MSSVLFRLARLLLYAYVLLSFLHPAHIHSWWCPPPPSDDCEDSENTIIKDVNVHCYNAPRAILIVTPNRLDYEFGQEFIEALSASEDPLLLGTDDLELIYALVAEESDAARINISIDSLISGAQLYVKIPTSTLDGTGDNKGEGSNAFFEITTTDQPLITNIENGIYIGTMTYALYLELSYLTGPDNPAEKTITHTLLID